MHRRTSPNTFARRPDASTERADGVGTPVQSDAVVGLFGFGGESLFKYTRQIIGNDTRSIIRAAQMQSLAIRVVQDLRGNAQRALGFTTLADRIGRVNNQIL